MGKVRIDIMGVTININGLSLCHKGSGGVATATVPDVCKTPSPGGPVPIPYPNIAFSKNLAKGTKTVKADGGNMAAIKGSEFSRSIGDEPGTVGGVKSGVNMKEATWLSYSFDVKFEGKNVCRLTDKMLMNHGNTVCLAGVLQKFISVGALKEGIVICKIVCKCDKQPIKGPSGSDLKQKCVKQALDALDTPPGNSTMKPEVSYNMTNNPTSPFMHRDSMGRDTLQRSHHWQKRAEQVFGKKYGGQGLVRRPDVIIVNDKSVPPYQSNIKAVVEIKFDEPSDPAQMKEYKKIAGKAPVIEVTPEKCECKDEPDDNPPPVKVPEPNILIQLLLFLLWLAGSIISRRPLPKPV
jgi:hypothetical protein